ncbi:MAG: radical SAM protein, partial [Verrucomicrobiaceae bacterium]
LTTCEKFRGHFRNLQQVFLYITDQCNLECEQCIYKPHVAFDSFRHVPEETVRKLLATFYNLGARKLTLLGGEPTLYGFRENHDPLIRTIAYAKALGYDYVRIDTNGQFSPDLIARLVSSGLDEFAFSIDDCDPKINDKIRGANTFKRSVANLERCVAVGARATITCCIHRGLCALNSDGLPRLHDMIEFGRLLGAHTVNFHDLFKVGVPMDTWTGRLDPTPQEYLPVYDTIRAKIDGREYGSVHVRLPQCFVSKQEFASNPAYYGYCPVKLGERVMVHADGIIRICSNLICTSWGTASFDESRVTWNSGPSNETFAHNMEEMTPCTNRSKRSYGELVPLCFSFKPDQEEASWKNLRWDERRNFVEIKVLR